jgi:hypothetical protein
MLSNWRCAHLLSPVGTGSADKLPLRVEGVHSGEHPYCLTALTAKVASHFSCLPGQQDNSLKKASIHSGHYSFSKCLWPANV